MTRSHLPDPYNKKNPPPSVEAARDRILKLQPHADRIKAQLDETVADDYQTEEDYISWREAAIRRRSLILGEIAYVERWLARQVAPQNYDDIRHDPGLRGDLADLVIEVDRVSGQMRRLYRCVYTLEAPPVDVAKAVERKKELFALHQNVATILNVLKEQCKQLGVSESVYKRVSRPLADIFRSALVEQQVVNTFLRDKLVDPSAVDFLLTLLDQAVSLGFELGEREARRVGFIRATLGMMELSGK